MPFDDQTKQQFIDAFSKKARDKGGPDAARCPLCTNNDWATLDGYLAPTIQSDLGTTALGGRNLPTIPIICTNCGFVAHISLGVLGLLPPRETTREATE